MFLCVNAKGGAAGTLSLAEVMTIRDEARAVMAKERARNGQSPISSPSLSESPSATYVGSKDGLPGSKARKAASTAAAAIDLSGTDGGTSACSLSEVVGDLFNRDYGDGEGVCHCVSRCLNMGAGIAKYFKRKYGGVEKLKARQYCTTHSMQLFYHTGFDALLF